MSEVNSATAKTEIATTTTTTTTTITSSAEVVKSSNTEVKEEKKEGENMVNGDSQQSKIFNQNISFVKYCSTVRKLHVVLFCDLLLLYYSFFRFFACVIVPF